MSKTKQAAEDMKTANQAKSISAGRFVGHYEGKRLDNKKRIFIPISLRDPSLSQVFTLTAHPKDPCVIGFRQEDPAFSPQTMRIISPFSFTAVLDQAGRILLDKSLVNHMKIHGASDIVVTGCDRHFEIWASSEWEKAVGEKESLANQAKEGDLGLLKTSPDLAAAHPE